jgi:hypothetical protein
MHLSPDMLESAYAFLLTTPPFRRWKLPHADEVEFRVLVDEDVMGHFMQYVATGAPIISISTTKIDHTINLISTVAHEMVHLKQAIDKTDTPDVEHNDEFKRLAKLVCKHHGYDYKGF